MNDLTLRLAKEAGIVHDGLGFAGGSLDEIEHLIALVRADEREKAARICTDLAEGWGFFGRPQYALERAGEVIRSSGG